MSKFKPGTLVGRVFRLEGGAMMVDLKADLPVTELAAIMQAISDYCQANGINPGTVARELSNIQMQRNHPGATPVDLSRMN